MIPFPLPIIVIILLATSGIMVVNQVVNFDGSHKKTEKKAKKKKVKKGHSSFNRS